MVIHVVRAVYLLVVLAFSVSFASRDEVYTRYQTNTIFLVLVPFALALGLVAVDWAWRRKRLGGLSGLFFGLLAGLFVAYVLGLIVDLTHSVFAGSAQSVQPSSPATAGAGGQSPLTDLVKVLLGASSVYACVSVILQTKDDFRFVIPYVEFSKQTKGAKPVLLDTSVIIDGRIADIADSRILDSQIVVPRFVLAELQAIADSEDKLKRNRGRRGLDVLNRLKSNDKVEVEILDARIGSVEEAPDVDAKLVALAKHLDARVITNDYNLNKIAQIRQVQVININDLANALKPVVLPGESLAVRIVKPGEEAGQGVGYLEDGTMVVAEQGRDCIGREVGITVTSVLQTSAGRMIFGRLDGDKPAGRPRRT